MDQHGWAIFVVSTSVVDNTSLTTPIENEPAEEANYMRFLALPA